jgi:hypothetical protein
VTYGNNIGYGSTLENALSDFKPGHTVGETLKNFGGSTTTPGGGTTGTPTPTASPSKSSSSSSSSPPASGPSGTVNQLLTQLDQAVTERNAAYDSHDADRIAAAEAKVQKIAEQLVHARSATPSSTPRASPSK